VPLGKSKKTSGTEHRKSEKKRKGKKRKEKYTCPIRC
jgi:hypothetical protein